jgi:cell division septation protein DedD
MQDKDIDGVIERHGARVDHWCLAALPSPRSADVQELAEKLGQAAGRRESRTNFRSKPSPIRPRHSQMQLSRAGENDRIVVFGSFYTVAGVMAARKILSSLTKQTRMGLFSFSVKTSRTAPPRTAAVSTARTMTPPSASVPVPSAHRTPAAGRQPPPQRQRPDAAGKEARPPPPGRRRRAGPGRRGRPADAARFRARRWQRRHRDPGPVQGKGGAAAAAGQGRRGRGQRRPGRGSRAATAADNPTPAKPAAAAAAPEREIARWTCASRSRSCAKPEAQGKRPGRCPPGRTRAPGTHPRRPRNREGRAEPPNASRRNARTRPNAWRNRRPKKSRRPSRSSEGRTQAAAKPADSARALAILEDKSKTKRDTTRPTPARNSCCRSPPVERQEKAAEVQAKLREAGISSWTQKTSTSSGELIRVRIGPLSRDDAEKVRAKLKGIGMSGAMTPV